VLGGAQQVLRERAPLRLPGVAVLRRRIGVVLRSVAQARASCQQADVVAARAFISVAHRLSTVTHADRGRQLRCDHRSIAESGLDSDARFCAFGGEALVAQAC